MDPKQFTKQFLSHIQAGWRVLDVGAGDGYFSRLFVERGAIVTAIEPNLVIDGNESIKVVKTSIENFVKDNQGGDYEAIFLRNVIQFLDKDWVINTFLPWTDERLAPNGVIGIETFFKEPLPPFEHPTVSLFGLEELLDGFSGWQTLLKGSYEHSDFDMKGTRRLFFTTDLIVQKTPLKIREG